MSRTRKRKNNYGKKIMLTFLVICMSIIMGGGLYAYRIMNKVIDPIDPNRSGISDKGDDANNDSNNEDKNGNDDKKDDIVIEDKKHITNILLIGTDDRKDGEGERADAIIIFTMDEKNKDMRLTSIMRDSYVLIPASKGREASREKINHSYAYGGVGLLMDTIETNFDLKLDKYVKIDFSGFKSIVEELGGIDVNIKSREELNELNRCLLLDIYDDPRKKHLEKFRSLLEDYQLLQARDEGAQYRLEDNPNISSSEYEYLGDIADFKYQTGYTHLDGRQTLAYSRMRHSTGGSSGRTSRQREVIDLLLDKLPDINPIRYFPLAETATDYIKTNMGIDEIVGFAKKALSIGNFQLKQLQIPPENLTEGRLYIGYNYSYVFLMDIPQVTEVLHKFVFDDMDYNPKHYKDFDYRTSDYYIEPPKKEEDPEKDGGETEETDSEETKAEDSDDNKENNNSETEDTESGDTDDGDSTDETTDEDSEKDNASDDSSVDNSDSNTDTGSEKDEDKVSDPDKETPDDTESDNPPDEGKDKEETKTETEDQTSPETETETDSSSEETETKTDETNNSGSEEDNTEDTSDEGEDDFDLE